MQIILLEKVINLGQLGEVVKVREGYARNFLIPQGKAKRATKASLEEFEKRRGELEKAQAEALTVTTGALAPADALQITVSTGEPALLSKRDRRADTVRDMLRAFRLDSRAKFEIDYELPRLLNGEIALLRYRLSDTQRSALREVLGERAASA